MKPQRILSISITAFFLVAFIWYGARNEEIFDNLATVSLGSLLLIALGKMVVILANGVLVKWTSEVFIKKLKVGEGLYVSILSAIGNFLGPLLGGAGIRALYLKKYHDLPYSKFTSTLFGYYLIMFSVNSIFALIAVSYLPHTSQSNILLLFFGVWLASMVFLMLVRVPGNILSREVNNKVLKRFQKILLSVIDGWRMIVGNKLLVAKLTALATVSYFGTYFVSLMIFYTLSLPIDYFALGLYSSLLTVAVLFSITPGSIGTRETILILVGVTIGISNEQVIQIAIIDRGVHFILLLVLFLATRNKWLKKIMTGRNVEV